MPLVVIVVSLHPHGVPENEEQTPLWIYPLLFAFYCMSFVVVFFNSARSASPCCADRERDPVYRESMAVARVLCRACSWRDGVGKPRKKE